MNIEEAFLAMLVLFGSIRFSGVFTEIGTLWEDLHVPRQH